MSEIILEVESLSKHYIIKNGIFSQKKIIHAARDISFSITENESLGLIGESGSGKSTVANMVLRLMPPSSGRVKLYGRDITDYDEGELRPLRKDIQIIFQHTNAVLDPKMTVDALLKEPLRIHHIVPDQGLDAEVSRLLELVGLSAKERWKHMSNLSGGQNQRVIIARAIATRAKLLVCDEPVSALDVSVQGQILNLLNDLKKHMGLSYLFISHDLKVIRHMCQRLAVMHQGRMVEIGPTAQILSNPKHEHTRALIDAML